jgi:hypothetical protein
MSTYLDRIFYDANGHTGNLYYYRIVRKSDALIWNHITKVLEVAPSWANSAVDIAESGLTGAFPIEVESALPADNYDLIIYKYVGSNSVNTDDVQNQYTLKKGSIFGF